ncbi:MAG: bifunctional YncE family protein/alkaline phosphatase family protein [Armatimonadetes bacterium]|nr:bifunctional YncE family protein/alkaline phosphatase family protein [Armatimonadota bacterium]
MSRQSRARRAATLWSGLAAALLAGTAHAQTNTLNTGKRITLPPLGVTANVGSLPMNMIPTPDGKYAVVSDMGFRQALSVIDTGTGALVSQTNVPVESQKVHFYYGLAFAPTTNLNGSYTLYASLGQSQGDANRIGVYSVVNGQISLVKTFPMTNATDYPVGLAADTRGYLYVASSPTNAVGISTPQALSAPGSLVILNASTGAEVGRYNFNTVGVPNVTAPNMPYAVAVLSNGSKAYVSSQLDGAVYDINTSTPSSPTLTSSVVTGTAPATPPNVSYSGSHPVALLLNSAQTALYVANAHTDDISVINTATDAVTNVSLRPAGAATLPGVTPTNLALAPNGSTLYVTLGDMNAVAEVSTASNRVQGYIPVGWYPSAIAAGQYRQLLVANAKGTTTRNPNPTYTPNLPSVNVNATSPTNTNPISFGYTEDILEGNVETLSLPTAAQLLQDTQQVLANNRLSGIGSNPLPAQALAGIKHVIYIVKENRTYDQVLGDEPAGNGEPSLALFGANVTPNEHALAERFVLLDNFYDCAEVSGDGWPWSTQGQANEEVIKNVPQNYIRVGGRRSYDFEGTYNNYPVGGFPKTDPQTGAPFVTTSTYLNSSNVAPPIKDVAAAPGGHIWDDVAAHGLSLRNYGFYYLQNTPDNTSGLVNPTPNEGVTLPNNFPAEPGIQPGGHNNVGKSDLDYRTYDLTYPDSEAPYYYAYGQFPTNPAGPMPFATPTGTPAAGALYPRTQFGLYNAPSRFSEWYREFLENLTADPTGNSEPNFTLLRLAHDHTQGIATGTHSPQAEVADADFAVGQVVQAISQSPNWNSTAIFVIEDDAQNGPDHVDCHRSICFVVSPWIKQNSVDHTFYNTDSVLKTMELLLGLPPMSQYDAVATPILDFGTAPNNNVPYAAILPAQSIVTQLSSSLVKANPALKRLALLSDKMDFVHPDSAPAQLLNEVIWKSVKGSASKMPAPRHTLTDAQIYFGPKTKLHAVKGKAGAKAKPIARDDDD